jgi:DNA gyrase subunit A
MCITSQGKSIKLKVKAVPVMGRAARGVRILSIDKPDFVIGVDRIVQEDKVYTRQDAGNPGADTEPVPAENEQDPPDAENQGDLFGDDHGEPETAD